MILVGKDRSKKAGMPPGTLIHVGKQKADKVHINLMHYKESLLEEKEFEKIESCFPYLNLDGVVWISIRGLHQVAVIRELGSYLGLHPLLQEDLLNTAQRPKAETREDCVFIIMKSLSLNQGDGELQEEQVSIILGKNFVISLEEEPEDLFEPIRERIRSSTGKIRKSGADYLAYSLLDILVDQYFVVLEALGEQLQDMDDELVFTQDKKAIQDIHRKKKQMLLLRRSTWPLREIISCLEKEETGLVRPETVIYLRDVYEHTVEVVESIEIYRETLTGMLDIYLTSVNNRMNEVMKVLTIIATIFIPLTFIAGVYGMNFRYMPELDWRWGYPLVLTTMAIVSAGMLFYFRKKKWL